MLEAKCASDEQATKVFEELTQVGKGVDGRQEV